MRYIVWYITWRDTTWRHNMAWYDLTWHSSDMTIKKLGMTCHCMTLNDKSCYEKKHYKHEVKCYHTRQDMIWPGMTWYDKTLNDRSLHAKSRPNVTCETWRDMIWHYVTWQSIQRNEITFATSLTFLSFQFFICCRFYRRPGWQALRATGMLQGFKVIPCAAGLCRKHARKNWLASHEQNCSKVRSWSGGEKLHF